MLPTCEMHSPFAPLLSFALRLLIAEESFNKKEKTKVLLNFCFPNNDVGQKLYLGVSKLNLIQQTQGSCSFVRTYAVTNIIS